jgi:glycosyltransferase involved in cell wall biosynthesis
LIDRIQETGLADRIWLPGYVPYNELPTLFHSADIYLSASYSDGSSVSLLEAMACGLPSFVTDIAGNREWIEKDFSGRWFSPGDITGLEDLLRQAPRMAAELADYGERARVIAEERADWRRNAPAMLEAYAMVFAEDRGAR